MAIKKEEKFLTYKGRPLVRSGRTLYYGNMADPYVIMMQINSTKKSGDMDMSGRVVIQLLNTDPDVRPRDRIVKKSEKQGLYRAMEIASIWLDKSMTEKTED